MGLAFEAKNVLIRSKDIMLRNLMSRSSLLLVTNTKITILKITWNVLSLHFRGPIAHFGTTHCVLTKPSSITREPTCAQPEKK